MTEEQYYRTLFVYAKEGRVRCLSPKKSDVEALRDKGWTHTATIDPAKWIEALANGRIDISDAVDELQFSK